jgi:hypothetical protein
MKSGAAGVILGLKSEVAGSSSAHDKRWVLLVVSAVHGLKSGVAYFLTQRPELTS